MKLNGQNGLRAERNRLSSSSTLWSWQAFVESTYQDKYTQKNYKVLKLCFLLQDKQTSNLIIINSANEQSSKTNFDDLPLDNHIKLPYMLKDEAIFVAFLKHASLENLIQLWCESNRTFFHCAFHPGWLQAGVNKEALWIMHLLTTYVNTLLSVQCCFSKPIPTRACANSIPPHHPFFSIAKLSNSVPCHCPLCDANMNRKQNCKCKHWM